MTEQARRLRLAEMGIDLYLPRVAPAEAGPISATAAVTASALHHLPIADAASVLLLHAGGEDPLLNAVARTLSFAGLSSAVTRADAQAPIAAAKALVVFGQAQARAVGALLSARQQAQIGWVAVDEPAQLRGNALAKRALWGELKRLLRELRSCGEIAV
ncbi:MAG: hypothetical protein IT467_00315 [Dokdonella sp.]|uniref:hypothetical protein n=1 Tax=Dokdonella sp. TaxID=2291710 RepID=UPI0025C359CE|nr:hypothetical protein [Dokdonella sp.]MBZ0223743.1 hypothetical protein [Dokdonella sp.]MCC7254359.1 hypothetical protein [Dokdonella sp.]